VPDQIIFLLSALVDLGHERPEHHQTLEVQYQNQLRVLYLPALLHSPVLLEAV
jgi:hypothetical protein